VVEVTSENDDFLFLKSAKLPVHRSSFCDGSGWLGQSFREIVGQQWNFSPPETIREDEEYQVELSNVTILELIIGAKHEWRSGSRFAQELASFLTGHSVLLSPSHQAVLMEYWAPKVAPPDLAFFRILLQNSRYRLRYVNVPERETAVSRSR